jgi:hypothetical protein
MKKYQSFFIKTLKKKLKIGQKFVYLTIFFIFYFINFSDTELGFDFFWDFFKEIKFPLV